MFVYETLDSEAKEKYPEERNYCGVIALAVLLECSFEYARGMLAAYGRQTGEGTEIAWLSQAIKVRGYTAMKVTYHSRTLNQLKRELAGTRGVYWAFTSKHVAAFRDGILEDWTMIKGGTRRPIRLYKMQRA